MTHSDRPAVQRAQPPKALYQVVNGVTRRMVSSPRRARRLGAGVLLLHPTGRKTGRVTDVPLAYARVGELGHAEAARRDRLSVIYRTLTGGRK
jgi:hypothetical protein